MYKKRIFTRAHVSRDVKITRKSLSRSAGKHVSCVRKHRCALRKSLFRDTIKPVPRTVSGIVVISHSISGSLSETLRRCPKLAYLQPESLRCGAKPLSRNGNAYSCMARRRFMHNYAKCRPTPGSLHNAIPAPPLQPASTAPGIPTEGMAHTRLTAHCPVPVTTPRDSPARPAVFKNKQQLKNKINTADSPNFIIFARRYTGAAARLFTHAGKAGTEHPKKQHYKHK